MVEVDADMAKANMNTVEADIIIVEADTDMVDSILKRIWMW